jgi:hypothetical protein
MSEFDELVKLGKSKGWVLSEMYRNKGYKFAAFRMENKKMFFMVQDGMFNVGFYGFIPDNPLEIMFRDCGDSLISVASLTFEQIQSLI